MIRATAESSNTTAASSLLHAAKRQINWLPTSNPGGGAKGPDYMATTGGEKALRRHQRKPNWLR